MTVAELIDKLGDMPGDLDVIYRDSLIGVDTINTVWLQTDPAPRCVVLE